MPGPQSFPVPSYTRTVSLVSSRSGRLSVAGGRRQSVAQSLGLRRGKEVDIQLEDQDGWVQSYSTFDEIKGTVKLKFDKDTPIDDLTVTFEGATQTYVEKVTTTAPTTGRTTGRHQFLKLLQPIEPSQLPEHNLAIAGQSYSIPFTFVVPDRLLPQICSHTTVNREVAQAHVHLPPSLGDASVAGDGQTLHDDLAPEMSKITYSILARVTRRGPTGRIIIVADKSIKIRIVPGRDEEPPTQIEDGETDYVLRKEETVRKSLFKLSKLGRLTAETSQPRSLRLPHPAKRSVKPVTTLTTVNLRFDPVDADTSPPQLSACTTKLRSYTFFGAAPFKALPRTSAPENWSMLHGVYPDHVQLSSRNLSTVSWTRHGPNESISDLLARRPSTFSDSSTNSIPEPSTSYTEGSPFYTATVLVPISLPTDCKKTFVPSFHSCVVSRSYALELSISHQSQGRNVTLKSPIQVSSEGGVPPTSIEETEQQIAEEIQRQFFDYENRQLAEASQHTQPTAVGVAAQPPRQPQQAHSNTVSLPPEAPEDTETVPSYASLGVTARHMSYPPAQHQASPDNNAVGDDAAPPEYYSGAISGRRIRSGSALLPMTQSVRTSRGLRMGGLFLMG